MPWNELVLEGEDDDLEAFLAGSGDVALLRGKDLEAVSLLDNLRELLDLPHHHLLYASPEGVDELVRRIGSHPRLEVRRRSAVTRAWFPFEAEAFSPETAKRIQGVILAPLPAGVSVVGLDEGETRDEKAVGIELYSPVHDYEYRAAGRIEGDLGGVVEVHRRMRDLDFLDPGRIELEVSR